MTAQRYAEIGGGMRKSAVLGVILGLGYVEQGIEIQGSDGQQSDLFEGFISEVG